MRLFQVVAENLLELGSTLSVDAVRPLDEVLMVGRACTLENSLVCGVANEDVVEAKRLLFGGTSGVELDELLVRQCAELRFEVVTYVLVDEMAHGVLDEQVPDHGRGLDHGALGRLEVIDSGREQRLNGRRDSHAIDLLGCAPGAAFEADQSLVDQHRQELLDEQRVPFRRGRNARPDPSIETGGAEQVLGDRACIVRRETIEHDPGRLPAGRPFGQPLHELVPR